jgi:Protein of unknown function (DUF3035)
MNRLSLSLATLLAAGLLAGCDDVRKGLGLEKAPPDEFVIVSRAPLELPPDYSLRPPKIGAQRPQEATPTQRARQTVFKAGGDQQASVYQQGNRSDGEMALLKQVSSGSSDATIRQQVDEETAKQVADSHSFVDSLLFWKTPEEPGTVVDPQKESQRLRENTALGKPATDGETPIIERKKKGGFLQDLF